MCDRVEEPADWKIVFESERVEVTKSGLFGTSADHRHFVPGPPHYRVDLGDGRSFPLTAVQVESIRAGDTRLIDALIASP